MFRHVVMFKWTGATPPETVAACLAALREFGAAIADMGTLSVGADAGVGEGNFDAVVVVDFPDKQTYLAYASDPRHVELVTTHLRPHLAQRVAVQYELG